MEDRGRRGRGKTCYYPSLPKCPDGEGGEEVVAGGGKHVVHPLHKNKAGATGEGADDGEHTAPHDTRHSLLLSLLVVVIFDSTMMLFSPWVRGGGGGQARVFVSGIAR
jgi:hypothetical protein